MQERPKNRCCVVYQVANNGVPQAEAILVKRVSPPDPVAGTIDGSGRFTQFRLAYQ